MNTSFHNKGQNISTKEYHRMPHSKPKRIKRKEERKDTKKEITLDINKIALVILILTSSFDLKLKIGMISAVIVTILCDFFSND